MYNLHAHLFCFQDKSIDKTAGQTATKKKGCIKQFQVTNMAVLAKDYTPPPPSYSSTN